MLAPFTSVILAAAIGISSKTIPTTKLTTKSSQSISQQLTQSFGVEIVPEYAHTGAIIMSAELFDAPYGADKLVRAILNADAQVLLALADPKKSSHLQKQIAKLSLAPEQRKRMHVLVLPHDNIWVRDYGPIGALRRTSTGREELTLFAALYDGQSSQNDNFAKSLAQKLNVKTQTIPIYLDGGNLLVGGRVCVSGDADLIPEPSLSAQLTAKPLGIRDLAGQIASEIGCGEHLLLTDPPHEHLDMWAKFTSDDTVLVNEIDAETMALAAQHSGKVPDEILALRANLDRQASRLASRFRVVRMPMPLPFRTGFRTYTNSLLINGTAIVPSYERYGWNYDSYPDEALKTHYEAKVKSIYNALGFNVVFLNADGLIYNGGAFHCVGVQVPAGSWITAIKS